MLTVINTNVSAFTVSVNTFTSALLEKLTTLSSPRICLFSRRQAAT